MRYILLLICLSLNVNTFSQSQLIFTIENGNVRSLDLENCTSHYVCTASIQFGDIAFTSDGRLWGYANHELYQIDTISGNISLVGLTNLNGVSLVGLNDSILLIESGTDLYGLNTNDASSYLIGHIGYAASGDLTWYDNDLYMTTSGFLIKIVLDNLYTSIISSAPVNSISNPIPNSMGAITASFIGSHNAIIGFSNEPNLICQIDGSYTVICPLLTPFGVAGAACFRLPTQQPLPTSCPVISSVYQVKLNEDKVSIFPNPISHTEILYIEKTKHFSLPFSISLLNSMGELVFQTSFKNYVENVSINLYDLNLNSGLYFIKTEDSRKLVYSKLLVK